MDSYLKVVITKDYGLVQVTIELSGAKQIGVVDSGLPEFTAAVTKINSMFDLYAVEHLPKLRATASIGNVVLLDAISIDVTIDKGKRYVKVRTPEFSEYGIAWWKEDMKAQDLDINTFPPLTGYKCREGSKVEVLMREDGKPKKVIRVIAPKSTG